MTNLYDFLRELFSYAQGVPAGGKADGIQRATLIPLSEDQFAWLAQYVAAPENLLEFKANKVGEKEDGEPIMAMDFAIAGDGLEIFCMVTEAMVQNFQFADIVLKAASFYRDHIPNCPQCSKRHFGQQKPVLNWDFSPHQPDDHVKK